MKIIKETETNAVEGTVLGQRVSAPETYSPYILVMVPRSENREAYGITNKTFKGYDTWYAYECSCLTDNGIPVQFGLQISYSAHSKYIVESKSLKLYLNSFNMERMGRTVEDAKREFITTVSNDLYGRLNLPKVKDYSLTLSVQELNVFQNLTESYDNLYDIVDTYNITCDKFNEAPEVLQENPGYQDISVYFNAFKSNCKITHAPDFATIFIKLVSSKGVDPASLIKYLTSFRDENHFHEECIETIYKRLNDYYQPKELMVRGNFCRRGGVDINPTRSSGVLIPSDSRTYFQ